jgi:DNA-binding transcriptional regulator YhcF (GntR family)
MKKMSASLLFDSIVLDDQESIAAQIERAIVFAIARGELAGGEALPSVKELADSLGVVPGSVAKAYRSLEEVGVIEVKSGEGSFVTAGVKDACIGRSREIILRHLTDAAKEAQAAGMSKIEFRVVVDELSDSFNKREATVADISNHPNDQSIDADQFKRLAQEWKRETILHSSPLLIATHDAYQRIIGMGPAAVPLILHELSAERDYWFWALRAITGDDPVPEEHRGDVRAMTEDWLEWGRARGLLNGE